MSLLTREELLSPATRRYEDFQTYDGRQFRVRSLTERERSEFEAAILDGNGRPKRDRLVAARRRLICMTLVGPDNELLFSQYDDKAMNALAEQDGRLMDDIYEAAATHCGIKNSDVEAIAKNS
jgi:hypothetical protein